MVKRLWLAVSFLWAALIILLYFAGGQKNDPGIVLFLVVAPFVIGYILLRAARFVIRGE